LRAAFPDVPEDHWPDIRARYPEAFDGEEEWRLHDYCYLVRTGRTVLLVDTGVGPVWALGAKWILSGGGLPDELAAAGVEVADVDTVVLTHAHLDHIGWNLHRTGRQVGPRFPNARYLLQRAEWEGFLDRGDEVDRAAFHQSVTPLESLGVLDLLDGERRIGEGLTVAPAPGHTPGHQVLVVESRGELAAITGDLANHPAQAEEPAWRASGDMDPQPAAESRARLLDRLEADGATICTAHWPGPFAHLVRRDGRRVVRFLDPATPPTGED
jgi:glyoxylase-like metal-dependent hydrolase (beta-lactamase superfamily II)